MSLETLAFLPSRASFYTTFLKIVVEVKGSGLPHVLTLWSGKQCHAPCKISSLQ